jgi:hypothetical protein
MTAAQDMPVVEELREGVRVVRDDLVPGGTKARVAHLLFDALHDEYVYAGPCEGYAQVALAYTCRQHGKRATLFCAERKTRHARTLEAEAAGARVVEVQYGYLSNVWAKARAYCEQTGAAMLPFGLADPRIRTGIADVARRVAGPPAEVWTVAGSGTLSLALQEAWPDAVFRAVRVGREVPDAGRALVLTAPERFEQDARNPPPFPSCSNYDAKAWRFILQHATRGRNVLMWNVAK